MSRLINKLFSLLAALGLTLPIIQGRVASSLTPRHDLEDPFQTSLEYVQPIDYGERDHIIDKYVAPVLMQLSRLYAALDEASADALLTNIWSALRGVLLYTGINPDTLADDSLQVDAFDFQAAQFPVHEPALRLAILIGVYEHQGQERTYTIDQQRDLIPAFVKAYLMNLPTGAELDPENVLHDTPDMYHYMENIYLHAERAETPPMPASSEQQFIDETLMPWLLTRPLDWIEKLVVGAVVLLWGRWKSGRSGSILDEVNHEIGMRYAASLCAWNRPGLSFDDLYFCVGREISDLNLQDFISITEQMIASGTLIKRDGAYFPPTDSSLT